MALRAGYYGVKRNIRNKLSILAASMPADISPENPIAGKNDVFASIGDTIYLNHCVISAHITSSGSDIFATLPFKCSIINGITFDIDCIVNARGNSGYIKDSAGTDISGSYKFVSNLKCSQILQGNNGITSVIIKNNDDNAFSNVTNNTPVVLEFLGNITLTGSTLTQSNREISEPEPATTKKATKKKVIKEEEE